VKVAAWVPQPTDTNPGQRYRIEQWAPHLAREGIELTFLPFGDPGLLRVLHRPGGAPAKALGVLRGLGRRARDAARARAWDLVYVFRETALFGPAVAERVLSARGVPYVFDFDDAVWVRYVSPANARLAYLRFPGKTATTCRLAAHVMAGNEYLREYAQRHNPHVSIVPTTIDTDRYRPSDHGAQGQQPVIGWTGSYSTGAYLGMLRDVLARLARRRSFKFVVVGATGFAADGVRVEHRPWRSATEVEDLADVDIGVMPLPDAEWERGKCGLKALQYMALGVPPVVSPVGVNTQIVTHGKNGLLAATDAEWEQGLERLLDDPALRLRLGQAARRTVEESYSAAVVAPRVAAIFREAAA
jgi:glycosyltransferase involved in cell wall biosynthesis